MRLLAFNGWTALRNVMMYFWFYHLRFTRALSLVGTWCVRTHPYSSGLRPMGGWWYFLSVGLFPHKIKGWMTTWLKSKQKIASETTTVRLLLIGPFQGGARFWELENHGIVWVIVWDPNKMIDIWQRSIYGGGWLQKLYYKQAIGVTGSNTKLNFIVQWFWV